MRQKGSFGKCNPVVMPKADSHGAPCALCMPRYKTEGHETAMNSKQRFVFRHDKIVLWKE